MHIESGDVKQDRFLEIVELGNLNSVIPRYLFNIIHFCIEDNIF